MKAPRHAQINALIAISCHTSAHLRGLHTHYAIHNCTHSCSSSSGNSSSYSKTGRVIRRCTSLLHLPALLIKAALTHTHVSNSVRLLVAYLPQLVAQPVLVHSSSSSSITVLCVSNIIISSSSINVLPVARTFSCHSSFSTLNRLQVLLWALHGVGLSGVGQQKGAQKGSSSILTGGWTAAVTYGRLGLCWACGNCGNT